MPKIDVPAVPEQSGSRYPAPFNEPCMKRAWRRLGDAGGLTQFGVNLVRLPPGCWSSQRHWHTDEDEFFMVLEGEVVMVTDAGEQPMRRGDCAAFKAGSRDGHHVKNLSAAEAVLLVVGSRNEKDEGEYPDIDLKFTRGAPGAAAFLHKDGTPY